MGGKIPGRIKKALKRRFKNKKNIFFFLDYDGTLTPIRKKPGLAVIGKGARSVLKSLARNKNAKVFILSGRMLKDVKKRVGLDGIYYIGNHGIEFSVPGVGHVNQAAGAARPHIKRAGHLLAGKLKGFKGCRVEDKLYTLSVHYRLVSPGRVPALHKALDSALGNLKNSGKLRISTGKKVVEVRPPVKCDKGTALKAILKRFNGRKALIVVMGDDRTDEDAFRAAGKSAITILVSDRRKKTAAAYRLRTPQEALDLLRAVPDLLKENS